MRLGPPSAACLCAPLNLRRVCADVRFLGSYPRRDGGRTQVRTGTSDADHPADIFLNSYESLESLRHRRNRGAPVATENSTWSLRMK